MSSFDWILLAIILLSTVAAAAHGFFAEVFSLAGVVIGFLIASWQYWRLTPWFEQYVKSPAMANAAGFIVIVVVISIVAGIAAKVSTWAMKEAGLRGVDRLLGGAFGLLRGLVMATVLVLVATSFVPDAGWLQRSTMARYFTLSARVASYAAPITLRTKFLDGIAYLRKVRQDALAKADRNLAGERHD